MYKFLHTADVHLDSPLLNLDRYDGAPVETFRSATRRALDQVVQLAIDQEVKFVLIAGDLYDGDCSDFNTPLHFRRQMDKLAAHEIQVFLIQGNHDADSKITKAFRLQLPDNVHHFRTDKPETRRIPELEVAIHGQGFAQRDVLEDLSQQYPAPVRGWLNIGLLHTSCGVYEGHQRYAPSTISGLDSKGYDYWALGHIHKREKLAGPRPWIVYPGNPQGRHIRESGARSCAVATVDGGQVTKVDWQATQVLRWETCVVDASELTDPDGVVAEAAGQLEQLLEEAGELPLAVRIEIGGRSQAHHGLVRHVQHWDGKLREEMLSRFDDRVWVEKIKFLTQPEVAARSWDSDDPLGQLLEAITDADLAQAALTEIRDDYQQLGKLLPQDPRLAEPAPTLEGWEDGLPETLLADVKELLLGQLLDARDRS